MGWGRGDNNFPWHLQARKCDLLGSTPHVNLYVGLYVTDREVLRLVMGFGVVRHVNLLILFWDGAEVCFCTR